MSILIAGLAAFGGAVVVLVATFFALVFVFDRAFDSDEGLGIVWLAGVGAIATALAVLVGLFVTLL